MRYGPEWNPMLGLQVRGQWPHPIPKNSESAYFLSDIFGSWRFQELCDITNRMYQDPLDMLQEGLILRAIRTCSVCALRLGHILMRVDHSLPQYLPSIKWLGHYAPALNAKSKHHPMAFYSFLFNDQRRILIHSQLFPSLSQCTKWPLILHTHPV